MPRRRPSPLLAVALALLLILSGFAGVITPAIPIAQAAGGVTEAAGSTEHLRSDSDTPSTSQTQKPERSARPAASLVMDPTSGPTGTVVSYEFYSVSLYDLICVYWDDQEFLDSISPFNDDVTDGSFLVPDGYAAGSYNVYFYGIYIGGSCGSYDEFDDDDFLMIESFVIEDDGISVILDPDMGPAGSTTTVSLEGFLADSTVTCTWDNNSTETITVDSDGLGSADIVVPNLPAGDASLSCTDGVSTDTGWFLVVAPSVYLDHTRGPVGSKVDFSIEGFPTDSTVTIAWNGNAISSVETDSYGEASDTLTVPGGLGLGDATIRWSSGSVAKTKTFKITAASASLAFPSAQPGYDMAFTLTGFLNNASVSVRWNGNALKTVNTNGQGGVNGVFTIPSGAAEAQHTVSFVSGGVTRTVTVRVVEPTASMSVQRGWAGTRVSFSIAKFPANARVTISFAGRQIGSVTTNGSGKATGSFVVPRQGGAGELTVGSGDVGTAETTAYTVAWKSGRWAVRKTFNYVQPMVRFSEWTGYVGDKITYRLEGWAPNRNATVVFAGVTVIDRKANQYGVVTGSFRVPPTPYGTREVRFFSNGTDLGYLEFSVGVWVRVWFTYASWTLRVEVTGGNANGFAEIYWDTPDGIAAGRMVLDARGSGTKTFAAPDRLWRGYQDIYVVGNTWDVYITNLYLNSTQSIVEAPETGPDPTPTSQPSATPSPTQEPAVTSTPQPSATPEPTEEPASTAAPEPTQEPPPPTATPTPSPEPSPPPAETPPAEATETPAAA